MGKGASKVLHTVTHPEEVVSELISHTDDLQNAVNTVVKTTALQHATPVVHTAPYAHIDSITVAKLPTITGQPGKIISYQKFPTIPPLQPPVIHHPFSLNTKTEQLTFVEKLEKSVQDKTVLASSAAGAAGGLALGGDNRALAMIVGGISPILAHALLAK